MECIFCVKKIKMIQKFKLYLYVYVYNNYMFGNLHNIIVKKLNLEQLKKWNLFNMKN